MSNESISAKPTELKSNGTAQLLIEKVSQAEETEATETPKKSVAIKTEAESVKKFTLGEPIIDQRNPFKTSNGDYYKTATVRKSTAPRTDKEKYKNAVNNSLHKSTSDDFITTEDVLKQSKYVTTYIKNPDAYFVYDPAVLARIKKDDELLKLREKKPIKKLAAQRKEDALKELKKKSTTAKDIKSARQQIPYKKCSKPNYPELSDIKVKVGTESDGIYFNPIEVKTNVKKFDERIKKINFAADDDLDDIEGPLTKSTSNSSDELTANSQTNNKNDETTHSNSKTATIPVESKENTFTSTITSRAFQKYLERNGLVLAPQKLIKVNETKNLPTTMGKVVSYKTTTPAGNSTTNTDLAVSPKKIKKSSIFQRLLSNNIFATRRRTIPKEAVPTRRSVYTTDSTDDTNMITLPSRRIVLERKSKDPEFQSNHSKRASEANNSRGTADYGSSSSISSALSNAEKKGGSKIPQPQRYANNKERPKISEPTPSNNQGIQQQSIPKPSNGYSLPNKNILPINNLQKVPDTEMCLFERTPVRRSLEPIRRTSQQQQQRQQLFGRSASMDRGEILKRSEQARLLRLQQANNDNNKSATLNNIHDSIGMPQLTSTPIKPRAIQLQSNSALSLASNVYDDNINFNAKNEWMRLRAMKENSDRELYTKVFKQKSQNNENLYERLPLQQQRLQIVNPLQASNITLYEDGTLVRNCQQRNTICGSQRERIRYSNLKSNNVGEQQQQFQDFQLPRSQSVGNNYATKDNFDLSHKNQLERNQQPIPRPANQTLSREEIIQKVKEFCRNSMRKKTQQQEQQNKINEIQPTAVKLSPVSYASVETQHFFPQARKAAPQVPQRKQSLQKQQPQQQRNTPHHVADKHTSTIVPNLPIYANISKCNSSSIQTNQIVNETDDTPETNLRRIALEENAIFKQKPPYLAMGNNDVDANGSAQYLLSHAPLESADEQTKWTPNLKCASESDYIMDNYNKNSIRHMPKLQNWPAKINAQQRQEVQLPLYYSGQHYGRSTPLILERSNYYPSQIYRPQYRQILPQYIANDRLLAQTSNPGLRPFSSNSLNVRHEVIAKEPQQQLKQEAFPLKQQKLQIFPYELSVYQQCQKGQELLDEEDWQNENKSGRQQSNDQVNEERRRTSRREDPRRHTLGGDMLQYGVMQGQPQQRAMDLEMGMRSQKNKKNQPIRSYAPINQGPLFDDDPGIMSEVETASTGFRRGGKQRSSLPVVRTPSKTLERPLGLVFLQYRSETKRALLPNEITSIDTVRALFVRSFPRQLTMAYLEGPNVKIYIHDASKDMFYELEDVRSHLREIRDRSVLRLFESNEVAAPPQVLPGGTGIPQPLPQQAVPMHWDQDQSYFSEPEFDSEYQHQHIHKSKPGKAPYYVGASQTLPRGMYSDRNKVAMGAPAKPLRSYGSRGNMGPIFPYPPDQLYSIPDGYTSSPERGTRGSYEEPYYSQYGTRGNVVAPIIDEENSEVAMSEDQYALYGMKVGIGRIPRTANQMYDPTRPEDLHRIRVEHMERQLANLTGLVQKALVNQNPQIGPTAVPTLNPNYLGVPTPCRGTLDETNAHSCGSHNSIQANGTGEEIYIREKAPKLGKSSCHKSVSFEKSVSFSDDIQGVPKSHSPQHAADTKPTKPAIKSSTLPRTSSQERDRLKPPPPPKPIALAQTHSNYRADIALAPEVYNHLRGLQKKAKDLRMEVRTLRRLSQAQAVAVREDIKDAFMRIRATLLASSGNYWDQQGDQEKTRISREEELYKQEVIRLEKDLSDLESSVEGLRGEVINRRTRVNMAAVEDMALVLSRASKTVAELKLRFPSLNNGIRDILSNEMEKVVREEKFLKEEPDRLESALRRCKKLTGTLVTLKRLASVQEQRLPPNEPTVNEDPPRSAEISAANKPVPSPRMGPIAISGGIPPENALDALLDELQTFARPLNQNNDFRPDDSTSDESSQAILSTVTTQIPQACLYNPNDQSIIAQTQELPEITAATAATAAAVGQLINHHQLNNLNPNANANMLQVNSTVGSLRRLHSYPSGSDTDTSPPQPTRILGKPPVPERNAELLSKVGASKRIPPPPPPRTSSRSPLASPTSPNVPHRMPSLSETNEPPTIIGNGGGSGSGAEGSGNSSGNESGNDQMQRQVALERRHQELLRKQKMLQEQYQRLQQMSKIPASALPPPNADIMQLKKTGSESNLPQKMGLCMSTATGSMKNLNIEVNSAAGLVTEKNEKNLSNVNVTNTNIQLVKQQLKQAAEGIQPGSHHQVVSKEDGNPVHNNSSSTTIKQVYETEIL